MLPTKKKITSLDIDESMYGRKTLYRNSITNIFTENGKYFYENLRFDIISQNVIESSFSYYLNSPNYGRCC